MSYSSNVKERKLNLGTWGRQIFLKQDSKKNHKENTCMTWTTLKFKNCSSVDSIRGVKRQATN